MLDQGWILGRPGRHGALARERAEAAIWGIQCSTTKTGWPSAPLAVRARAHLEEGAPPHRRCHTRFPAASQPFCSPSSIYLIINSAITINSWGCCSHVDQSSAVVRAEQGHVSSPGGLLSPGINCSRHVCCGCTGPGHGAWGLMGAALRSPWPWHWCQESLVQGQNALFSLFCSSSMVLSAGGWLCLVHL